MSNCHTLPALAVSGRLGIADDTRLIALAGQPNMGKSTLFNLLTGLHQHVGNWPGKTIERREGVFSHGAHRYCLVDLPGTYSLTANSPEELIAREFILRQHPDIVVAVVSAANLERSLYLVSELVCLPVPLIVALNMMDVAEQQGLRVDPQALSAAIGLPVVPITATKAAGVDQLLDVIEQTLAGECRFSPSQPEIRHDHRQVLEQIRAAIADYVPEPYPADWVASKLLEGDADLTNRIKASLPAERWETVYALLRAHDDALLAVASGRYEWIGRIVRAAVVRPQIGQIGLTERLDRWATHPIWGMVILAGILGLVFWLTFAVGTPVQNWLDVLLVAPLASAFSTLLNDAPAWLHGLIVEGVIGGVGSVLTFLPIMVIFFTAFGFLEDIGYLARAAFVMDNLMHLMGLHGKSFLPLFLGFGCNVPAVMGTRVIDSWSARLLTILIAPLVPCAARMGVLAFLAPAFFGQAATIVSWGLVMFSLLMLVVSGIVLNRLIFHGQRSAFIMEMPLYHLPNPRTIGLLVWQRSLSFVKKAGTIILAFSSIVWLFSTLPGGDAQTGYLARLGRLIEPLGQWMGMDWRLLVALLTSFLAKENAVATLGVLFGKHAEAGLAKTLATIYPPAVGLSFLAVSLLFIPCAATTAAIRQETGSWRWTAVSVILLLLISLGTGILIYQGARWLGWGV